MNLSEKLLKLFNESMDAKGFMITMNGKYLVSFEGKAEAQKKLKELKSIDQEEGDGLSKFNIKPVVVADSKFGIYNTSHPDYNPFMEN